MKVDWLVKQVLRCFLKKKIMTRFQQLINDQITSINYGSIQDNSSNHHPIDASGVVRDGVQKKLIAEAVTAI